MDQEQAYLSSLQLATRATIRENLIILDTLPGKLDFYLVGED